MSSDHPYQRFINSRRTSDAKEATFTGMDKSNAGKWRISDEDYPAFLDLMYDYIFEKKRSPMAFVERPRPGEHKPLMIDLDFKYSHEASLQRSFKSSHIRGFTELLLEGVRIFFGVSDFQELRFFVTLRPGPYKSAGVTKDGVHILCPDITLTDEKQRVLRNWILFVKNGIQEHFGNTGYTNSEVDIYDESMVRGKQGWFFYGESKPSIQPYSLHEVIKYIPEEDEWEYEPSTAYTPRQLMELLSIRYNLVADETVVLEEAKDLYEEMKNMNGQRQGHTQIEEDGAMEATEGGASAAAAGQQPVNQILQGLQSIYTTTMAEQDQLMIRRFVMECLGSNYYESYDKWIRVGWCLHNIAATEENFQLWMDFSAKSPKANGNNVAQLRREWFSTMRKEGDGPRLTERSLRHWAKEENLKQHDKIISEYLGEYIRQEVEPTHHHIAQLLKKMYGSSYIASVNPKTTEWYKYDDQINMWKKVNQGIELRMKLTNQVVKEITDSKQKIWSQMNQSAANQEVLQAKLKNLTKTEMQLYSSGFGDSVMKMAVHQFYEEDFHNKLNVNPFLFGCRNGVLDLRVPGPDGRDHVVFRQGRPEDYVSFLAGQNLPEFQAIDYVKYDAADPKQIELADFFSKLFPEEAVRNYTLRLLASCLEGMNREQCFYVATGVGGNGKSKLVELMRITFGDYQTSLQTTVLTRKRPESGAANPDIMAAKSRRFICMQEPDDKEPINTSRMKQFSGEDMVEARGLFQDQEKFVIMGKLFMMCNKLPPVTSMDRGTWRRIRVIEFVSKFVSPEEPEYIEYQQGRPNVFLKDPQLDRKLREWREAFLGLLVHIYETQYISVGLQPVPESVMRASNKYKESFDMFARFRSERIRKPTTPEELMEAREMPVSSNQIKSCLSAWSKETGIKLSAQEVLNSLMLEFGEPIRGKEWPSILLFRSDEEIAEWDKEHSQSS